jgi:hypothetical protein
MVNMHNLTMTLNTPFQSMDPAFSYKLPYYLTALLSETQIYVLTTLLTTLLPPLLALYIHRDYKAFLSLGPGGTPSTPLGYLKLKCLSVICLRQPLQPMPIAPHFRPQKGYLNDDSIPQRKGERPLVEGIAPQRQQTQKSNAAVYQNLVDRIHALAEDPRNRLEERTSCFEKYSSGLFTKVPITRTKDGEICHAHPSDGSMHLSLHPSDAKVALENGWGQRHPLARGGWCRRFVPKEFTLIYAPRTVEEVEILMQIVAASIWWVSGIDVNGDEVGPRRRSKDVEAVSKAMEGRECRACKARLCVGPQVEALTGDA